MVAGVVTSKTSKTMIGISKNGASGATSERSRLMSPREERKTLPAVATMRSKSEREAIWMWRRPEVSV